MGHRYLELLTTPAVRAARLATHGADAYADLTAGGPTHNARLGAGEVAFIAARDSFLLASVSQSGWPYVQVRGGPRGFLRVLDEETLGFADFGGNRQYLTVGNTSADDRVALLLIDYSRRRRLKLLARAALLPADDPRVAGLVMADYDAPVERGVLLHVEGFDWNCPRHLPIRYDVAEVEALAAPLRARLAGLEGENAALSARVAELEAANAALRRR